MAVPPDPRPHRLVLLRHGRTAGFDEDTFTGWLDVPLTPAGRAQAVRAGELLAAHGLLPDAVHTSALGRAVETATLVLAAAGRTAVPVRSSWRLNERHYGALQGRSRWAVRAEVGDELFRAWRRSFEATPPPAPAADDGAGDPGRGTPRAESLADVRRRLVPWWEDAVVPGLRPGAVTLVVGHSNSLRALCMHLDRLSPQQVMRLDLPAAVPLLYHLDDALRPLAPGGRFLDRSAADRGLAEVRRQGRRPPGSPPPPGPRSAGPAPSGPARTATVPAHGAPEERGHP